MDFDCVGGALTQAAGAVDQKVEMLSAFQSALEARTVRFEADKLDGLVGAVARTLKAPHHGLSTAALSVIGPLVDEVRRRAPGMLKTHVIPQFFHPVVDRLGDTRDRTRELARDILVQFWSAALSIGEHEATSATSTALLAFLEKESKCAVFNHKMWRVREQAIFWLIQCIRQIPGFSLRQYTPYMVGLLEDPNEVVRETSKGAVITLFRHASPQVQADLKRNLQKSQTRPTIVGQILSRLQSTDDDEEACSLPDKAIADQRATISVATPTRHASSSKLSGNSTPATSHSSLHSASSGSTNVAAVSAIHFDTQREVEAEFAKIAAAFRDKETEFNWDLRDKSLNRIRGMLDGGVHQRFPEAFSTGLKPVMDGIMTSFKSLRTTLALSACATVKDLCDQLQDGMDPYLEQVLTNGMKGAQNTKKLLSAASQQAVQALVRGTTYQVRTLHTLYSALQDKNVNLRAAVTLFVKELVEAAAQNGKIDVVDRTGGTDLVEKILRKTLGDASPGVRETSREVFAVYRQIWPGRADGFLNTVDLSVRKQLAKLPRRASAGTAAARLPPGSSSSVTLNLKSSAGISRPHRGWPAPNSQPMSRSTTEESLDSRKSDKRDDKENLRLSSSSSRTTSPPSQRPSPPQSNTTPSILSPGLQPSFPDGLLLQQRLASSDPAERADAIDALQQSLRSGAFQAGNRASKQTKELTPLIYGLFADESPLVQKRLLRPEVVTSLLAVVPLEQVLPRIYALAEDEKVSGIKNLAPSSSAKVAGQARAVLAYLKEVVPDNVAACVLAKCLVPTGAYPPSRNVSSSVLRRKVAANVVRWMADLVERYLDRQEKGQENDEEYFSDVANVKLYLMRAVPLSAETSARFDNPVIFRRREDLARLLGALRRANSVLFEQVVGNFDEDVAQAVRSLFAPEGQDAHEDKREKADAEMDGVETENNADVDMKDAVSRKRNAEVRPGTDERPPVATPTKPSCARTFQVDCGDNHEALDTQHEDPSRLVLMDEEGLDAGDVTDLRLQPEPDAFNSSMFNDDTILIHSRPQLSAEQFLRRSIIGDTSASTARDLEEATNKLQSGHSEERRVPNKSGQFGLFSRFDRTADQESSRRRRYQEPLELGEKKKMLALYVRQVRDGEADQSVFRKMIRLSREAAVFGRDRNRFSSCTATASGSAGSDLLAKQNGSLAPPTDPGAGNVWEGAEKFTECIEAIITFLTSGTGDDGRESCLCLLRTLAQNQGPYFSGSERAVLSVLLECRTDENLRVCSAAEAALTAFAECVDRNACMEAFREITYLNLDAAWRHMSFDIDVLGMTNMLREPPPAVAFLFLEKLLHRYEAPELEPEIPKLAPLVMKGILHQSMHVRKRSVEVFVTMQEIVGPRLLEHFPDLDDPLSKLLAVWIQRRREKQAVREQSPRTGIVGAR